MRHKTHTGQDGFTVIEVILFLAISAGLIVALLGTVGGSISRQRFTDSVSSLQAFFQQQYNETLNVVNDRQGSGLCGAGTGGTTVTGSGGVASERGASDCVILGRAIDLTPNSAHIVVHDVVGREPTAAAAATLSGSDLLKLYFPGVDDASATSYDIPWDAGVKGITPATVTRIVLLRSPDSGIVLAYGGNTGPSLQSMLDSPDRTYNICIGSADLIRSIAAVRLFPVSGSEAVQTKFEFAGTEKADLCAL